MYIECVGLRIDYIKLISLSLSLSLSLFLSQAPNIHRWDGPPFAVKGSETEFSLIIQGNELNILYYVLKFDQIYEVEVSMLVSVICLSVCKFVY